MHLSNYQATNVTMSATDATYAVGIVTSGTKARVVLYAAIYDGTNTAGSSLGFGIQGSNASNAPGQEFQVTAGGDPFYHITWTTSALGASGVVIPDIMLPMHAKQNLTSGPGVIIPPAHSLACLVRQTNLNGTVVVQVITAEID